MGIRHADINAQFLCHIKILSQISYFISSRLDFTLETFNKLLRILGLDMVFCLKGNGKSMIQEYQFSFLHNFNCFQCLLK